MTKHHDVAEAAVVGLPDQIKGHVPIGFCVLGAGMAGAFFYSTENRFCVLLMTNMF